MSHETVRRYDDDEPRKETSIVDQLFLELSQFTQAVTAQESRLLGERHILLGELAKAKTERDALRTQARELAREVERIKGNGSPCTDFGRGVIAACKDIETFISQQAQAVLDATKEGA